MAGKKVELCGRKQPKLPANIYFQDTWCKTLNNPRTHRFVGIIFGYLSSTVRAVGSGNVGLAGIGSRAGCNGLLV
jgi:hypothetical protein